MSNKLPSVTSEIPRDLRTFIDRLREIITGNGSDRFVTAQDLINGGLAGAGTNGTLVPIKKGVIAPPPAPQNLTATGSVNDIFVEWDNPTYYGHDYTEVYSSGTDVLGDAVLLGFTPGVNYVDTIGPQQSRYYWARFINTEGTAGPFNAVNGTLGQTGIEVEHMLDVLTGAITESQLYQDLGARINLIDGPSTLPNSVSARLLAEATARSNAILAESNTRAAAILAEANARGAAITSEANTRQAADSSLASQITTITSSVNSNAAAIQTEATTRADADNAEAALRVALAARVTNAETGLTAAQAAITNEANTRATQDTAIASSVTALSAQVNNPTTGLAATRATLTQDYYTKTATDSAISSATTSLASTTYVTNQLSSYTPTATLVQNYYTKTATDSAISSATTGLVSSSALTTALGSYTPTATLTQNYYTKTQTDSAISSATTSLASTTYVTNALASYTPTATLTLNYYTKTQTDSAISSATTTLTSRLDNAGGTGVALETAYSTQANAISGLSAKYTVKIDNNGYVSGFGLASEANNATPFSSFVVRADRFSISSPTGPGLTPITPFIVTTTPQVIDGTNVPAGVYIDGGYIKGGTISGSKIIGGTIKGSALIDVSADKITGAALQATSYIESAAYIPGTQGWKIHANGTAEFAAASIRGQLTASQIDTRNLTIKDANGTVLFGSGTPLSYSSLTGTPSLGSLAYLNSVSAGNVSGLGSLATQSSVNWNTQISNIPAFGGFAFLSTITSANIANYMGPTAITEAYIANAAITNAKIKDGEVTNAKIGGIISSTNYSAGSSGWKIDKAGSAEFNDITVRSGQIIGALGVAYKIQSNLALFVQINTGTGISTVNGPYSLNGTSPPQYLVYSNYMPANATAPHKIAVSVNVQSTGYGSNKDLSVLILVNAYLSGSNIYADEQIAYNTNSGVYGLATNATGVSTNTYSTAVPVMIFVGGYNAYYTIQTVDGIAWGVR